MAKLEAHGRLADLRLIAARALVRRLGSRASITLTRREARALARLLAVRPAERPAHRPAGAQATRDAAIWREAVPYLLTGERGAKAQMLRDLSVLFAMEPQSIRRIVDRFEREALAEVGPLE